MTPVTAVDIDLSAPQRQKRFKLVNRLPLADEAGHVGIGYATKTRSDGTTDPTQWVVEDRGTQSAVTVHAVATGIAGGIVSPSSLVAAFKAAGTLDALAAEVIKAAGIKVAPPGK